MEDLFCFFSQKFRCFFQRKENQRKNALYNVQHFTHHKQHRTAQGQKPRQGPHSHPGQGQQPQPSGAGKGTACAECGGDGNHKPQRGTALSAEKCVRSAGDFFDGMYLITRRRALNPCAQRSETFHSCDNVVVQRVHAHFGGRVGKCGGDEQPVRVGFRGRNLNLSLQ